MKKSDKDLRYSDMIEDMQIEQKKLLKRTEQIPKN